MAFVYTQGSSTSTSATGPGASKKPQPVSASRTSPLPQPEPRLSSQHYPETGNAMKPMEKSGAYTPCFIYSEQNNRRM